VYTGDKNNTGTQAGNIKLTLVGDKGSSGIPTPLNSFETNHVGEYSTGFVTLTAFIILFILKQIQILIKGVLYAFVPSGAAHGGVCI
jgi:hypothetical protein